MTIDNDTIRTWLQALAVLGMPVASMIYTWIATRDKDNSQHIKAVEEVLSARIADHAVRLERLEGDMKHQPSHSDMAKIHDRMTEQGREVARMSGELIHINDNLRMLVHQFKGAK
jgi:hypothetical protein